MYYGNVPFFGISPQQNPTGFSFYPGFQQGYAPAFPPLNQQLPQWIGSPNPTQFQHPHLPTEQIHLLQRMDLLCQQVAHLTEMVRAYAAVFSLPGYAQYQGLPHGMAPTMYPSTFGIPNPTQGNRGYMTGTPNYPGLTSSPVGVGYEHSPVQIRETESYICWQIPFQNLNLGDVEVEVLGNHIICRTKTVVQPAYRFWQWSILPQGVQFFDLPDGRVECSCIVPVAFESKEVEAVFKDGAILIYIPKTETNQRQSVKIGKDMPQYVTTNSGTRKNAELRP